MSDPNVQMMPPEPEDLDDVAAFLEGVLVELKRRAMGEERVGYVLTERLKQLETAASTVRQEAYYMRRQQDRED